MSFNPETELQNLCKKWCEKHGYLFVRTYDVTSGFPDALVFTKNGTIAVEFKIAGGKVSLIQQSWLNKINTAGQKAVVVYSLNQFIEEVTKW